MFSGLQDYILTCCKRNGDRDYCLYKPDAGEVAVRTYRELLEALQSVGTFLSRLNLAHCHVALLGETGFEWIAAYLGSLVYGLTVIPLGRSMTKEMTLERLVFTDADVLLFDSKYADVADYVLAKIPGILCFQLNFGEGKHKILSMSIEKLDVPISRNEKEPAEIVFTSGTTGGQKAVILSCENVFYTVMYCIRLVNPSKDGLVLSVLPNNHTFELAVNILAPLYFGMSIGINDSIIHFKRNIRLFCPTHMLVVPAILNAIRKETLYSVGYREDMGSHGLDSDPKKKGKMICELQALLGGRLTTLICGGAYLSDTVAEFFETAGFRVIQGYGITECAPVVSCNSELDSWKLGRISPYCEVQVSDGEICVRGHNVMLGYYKDPEQTQKAFAGGWFHTGDEGRVDEYRCLELIGRRDRMLVMSNGENVNPEEIEGELNNQSEIEECVVSVEGGFLKADIYPGDQVRSLKDPDEMRKRLSRVVFEVNRVLPIYKRIERFDIHIKPFERTLTRKVVRTDSGKGQK